MSPRRAAEICIFCDASPCTCNAKPRKANKVARAAVLAERPAPAPQPAPVRVAPLRDVEELVMEEALRALGDADLLTAQDRIRLRSVLTDRLSASDRARVWNFRRQS